MLENHLIDDLDEDLLLELDEVVRGNQLNCLPFVKSGRAELLLHERHPSLAGEIDEERERRIRDMAFRDTLKDDDGRLSSSYRARIGSLDDIMSGSPSQEKSRRRSRAPRNAPFSPTIRPKDSTVDLMFDMDDDDPLAPGSPRLPVLKSTPDETRIGRASSASIPVIFVGGESPTPQEEEFSSVPSRPTGSATRNIVGTPPSENTKTTWSSPVLSASKLGMKEIMAQASTSRTSNLSMSLSAQKVKDDAKTKTPPPKLSQKERKKQQQQASTQFQTARDEADAKSASPWQVTNTGSKTSLKDVLGDSKSSPSASPAQLGLPITSRSPTPRRTASPDTRFSGQTRSVSHNLAKPAPSSSGPSRNAKSATSSPVIPRSKSYMTPAAMAEPSLQLSMADIMGQQTREQEVIKEAVAKRSLQEIQEEQAFQEWWDQESRRAQEAEAARAKGPSPATSKSSKTGAGRGTRGRGGKSGGRRGRGQESA